LVAAAKFLAEATKKIFVVPNFVAVTKPFFFRAWMCGLLYPTARILLQKTLTLLLCPRKTIGSRENMDVFLGGN